MARVTSVPPEEAVPAEDLEAATEVAAPPSSGWGQRMRRLVPTRTIDTRSAIERLWDAPPRDARLSWLLTLGLTALAFCIRVVGLDFVMSRLALLDIFEAFFIAAGVLAVVIDRDYFRHRLARDLERKGLTDYGGAASPFIFRPWLIVAGVLFGLAMGAKWNAVIVVPGFGVLAVVWSITARRLAGARRRSYMALLLDGVPAFVSLVLISFVVYVATWFSWLRTQGGYDRQWGAEHPDSWLSL